MWIRKKRFVELCQLVHEQSALSEQSLEATSKAQAQVEELLAMNSRLIEQFKSCPDHQVIIDQANDDALRATAMREHSEFVESLLAMLCAQ